MSSSLLLGLAELTYLLLPQDLPSFELGIRSESYYDVESMLSYNFATSFSGSPLGLLGLER